MPTPGTGSKTPVVALVGPTASGKSAIAVVLAKRLSAEIVSADSMQVYRYMDIGTAKPSEEERGGVPHHLIDVALPGERFSAAMYRRLADTAVSSISRRGRLPMLVGGTGLYVRSVLDDYIFDDEGTADPDLRQELEELGRHEGGEALHAKLRKVDPAAASRIHPNDLRRVIRALEVFMSTGTPISKLQGKAPGTRPRYKSIMVGLTRSRPKLYEAIDSRVDEMMRRGLVDEVRSLQEAGYGEGLTSAQALGYKEIVLYLKGLSCLDEAVRLIKRDTRRYAKRQLTWFRRDRRITWFDRDAHPDEEALISGMAGHIDRELGMSPAARSDV
ncbi:MAG: tRNA (adenosine(37)-N6)-dimethylallyltransferase MiaA [Firmicutes bacterium]|nr:tRNA (adenosine(37)-N6)-dimethylallyltransferase MiaA [Bacillota bacterium]